MDEIKPGLSGAARMMVGTSDTAPRVGSGHISVLATPRMIGLMEEAALAAVERLLPEGRQSLGTRMDVSHLAATPIGMTVEAIAEVVAVEGRRLTFAVRATDEMELVGEGRHERVVVTAATFQARIDEKRGR
jgi:predicted thioesterase